MKLLAFLFVPNLKANAAVAVSFMLCLLSIWPITAGPKINQLFVLYCG